jgi:hypothetical protein
VPGVQRLVHSTAQCAGSADKNNLHGELLLEETCQSTRSDIFEILFSCLPNDLWE